MVYKGQSGSGHLGSLQENSGNTGDLSSVSAEEWQAHHDSLKECPRPAYHFRGQVVTHFATPATVLGGHVNPNPLNNQMLHAK